jgi:hypothetical protein
MPATTTPDRAGLLSAAEAARDPELFAGSVTTKWLQVEAREGRIPCYRFGRRTLRFSREELRAYIDRSRRPAHAS